MASVEKFVGLFLLFYLPFYNSEEIKLNITHNGFIGSNGSELECTFTRLKVNDFFRLTFAANSTLIAIRTLSAELKLSTAGKYLEGRVYFDDLKKIAANTTHITSQARMILTDMQCIDDNIYNCSLEYSDSSNDGKLNQIISKTSPLIVKVLPSSPNITITRHVRNVEPATNTSTYTTTPANTNQNISLPTSTTQNEMCNLDEQTYIEGDSITISCTGEVGNPPGNLTVLRIRNDGHNFSPTDYDPIHNFSENCSNYQHISFSIILTAEDNGAVFQCLVVSSMYEGTSSETDPFIVLYSVRTPVIDGALKPWTNPPLELSCHASGNPKPYFVWYKFLNALDKFDQYSDQPNITLNNATDSGTYRCVVKNSICQQNFTKKSNTTVKLIANTTPTPTDPPNIKDKNDGTDQQNITYVIGGVAGGIVVLIVVVVLGIKCCGNRKPNKSQSDDKPDDRLVHQLSTRQTAGADYYYSVSLDDDGKGRESNAEDSCSPQEEIREHNEKYLKQQAEDDARNEARLDHQPVEYAMVNKSFKYQSSKQQIDQHQPTEYAQVQKTKPIGPPQVEDHYASGQDIYDQTHNRRHKQPTESDPYDTPANINRKKSEKVGSVVENKEYPMKQKKVAKVKPSGRAGYENYGIVPDDVIKEKEQPNTEL